MIATASHTAVLALRFAVDGLLALDWPALAVQQTAGLLSELEVERRRLARVDVAAATPSATRVRSDLCPFGVVNDPVADRFLSDPVGRMGS